MIRSREIACWLITSVLLFLFCATARAQNAHVTVYAQTRTQPATPLLIGVCLEDVNHEVYGGLYSQMIFGESFAEPGLAEKDGQLSAMWRPIVRGSAVAEFALDKSRPFIGSQSQRITFRSGEGEVGIENRGLGHWGMNLVGGKSYEGCVWVRADAATELIADFHRGDDTHVYASQSINILGGDWVRCDIHLTPEATDANAAFGLKLTHPGSLTIGYAFIEPGPWGRYKNLPVRKDIIEGLLQQGITVMRYGGSMVNSPEYRWKKMVVPRDRRPPYAGHWYPYSSNGWGVIDFLNLCEAANVVAVPDMNVNGSPRDIADFVQYVNGPASSEWGQRRATDGHPAPYRLTHLEIGNEERVDDELAAKFNAIAQAVWAVDPEITLVVGDFAYKQTIADPEHINGADSGITNLDDQRRILDFAAAHHREVWFDVHVWSEGLTPTPYLLALPSYIDAIDKLASGAKHRVVCFELNANSHGQHRALANAVSINTIRQDGRMPIVTSANALQPDGENDNGWDQGLLFFNPSKVWTQPPLMAMGMQLPSAASPLVQCEVEPRSDLSVVATAGDDGKTMELQIVNPGPERSVVISFNGFAPVRTSAYVTELVGPSDAVNTAIKTDAVHPVKSDWHYAVVNGAVDRQLPAQSFTVIRFE